MDFLFVGNTVLGVYSSCRLGVNEEEVTLG